MTINEIQDEIIDEFSGFDDWMDKYQLLIDLGNEQEPLDEKYKVESNLIDGCQSRVWLQADYVDGKINFTAESDALIVKGIVALLIRVLSGHTPQEILDADLYFIEQIGLVRIRLHAFAHQCIEDPPRADFGVLLLRTGVHIFLVKQYLIAEPVTVAIVPDQRTLSVANVIVAVPIRGDLEQSTLVGNILAIEHYLEIASHGIHLISPPSLGFEFIQIARLEIEAINTHQTDQWQQNGLVAKAQGGTMLLTSNNAVSLGDHLFQEVELCIGLHTAIPCAEARMEIAPGVFHLPKDIQFLTGEDREQRIKSQPFLRVLLDERCLDEVIDGP